LKVVSREEALRMLSDAGLLITSTPQLAAQWRQRFTTAHDGLIETPDVFTWQVWMQHQCMADMQAPVPLTALQEDLLWEQVIADDLGSSYPAGTLRGLAAQAASSYELLVQYRVPLDELGKNFSEEGEALARWIEAIHSKLASGTLSGRALNADIPHLLLDRAALLPSNTNIIFDGFDVFSPMHLAWHGALQKSACVVSVLEAGPRGGSIELNRLPDEISEYRLLASRIRDVLEKTPEKTVAIITAQNTDQALLNRVLDETLLEGYSEQLDRVEQSVQMKGEPLVAYPLIHQMLHLLSLAGRDGAAYSDASPLLFASGLKAYEEERFARACLDARWREKNRHYISFKSLLASDELLEVPALGEILKLILAWSHKAQSAREWVQAVHGLLQSTGFLQTDALLGDAGQGRRNSFEVRQLNAFRDCMGSLVAADGVCKRLDWPRFLSLLRQACSETALPLPVCHPQVMLLPLSSMAGLHFDVLFAIGMNDQTLPMPARMQPLLPLALQRKHGLPVATPELAFTASVALRDHLFQAAPQLYLSYASLSEERERSQSPLLAEIEETAVCLDRPEPILPEIEEFADAPLVPLPADEVPRGGSAIIKHYSACPFRAFATHRLAISELGETTPGIEAKEKGSLIHHALEFIWLRLQSKEGLAALDDAATEALISEAVQYAWDASAIKTMDAVQHFEQQRMHGVLREWLALELERPAFRVLACESQYELRLPEAGNVSFAVRMKADRLDEDEQGRRILIDYKTGQKQSIGKWLGERMEEPQLPLYSMAAGLGAEDAVAFARVRSGDMGFEGLCGEDTGIKGISPCDGKSSRPEDWPQVLQDWRQEINALAESFVHGHAQVSPRDASACDYCGLEAVCRIDELGFDNQGGFDNKTGEADE